uniref:Uncharacterized protein n=1 Tax=Spongospora subterranea TaxID=70186 RepID=A0A0H5QWN1_9EUKA|eukprot:CRZ06315.1 hypothetical protein [Spongospora subterranea]
MALRRFQPDGHSRIRLVDRGPETGLCRGPQRHTGQVLLQPETSRSQLLRIESRSGPIGIDMARNDRRDVVDGFHGRTRPLRRFTPVHIYSAPSSQNVLVQVLSDFTALSLLKPIFLRNFEEQLLETERVSRQIGDLIWDFFRVNGEMTRDE